MRPHQQQMNRAPRARAPQPPRRHPLPQAPRPGRAPSLSSGRSGDLTRRKLVPALFELASQKSAPPRFAVLGFARTPTSDEAFRETATEAVRKNSAGSGAGLVDEEKLRAFAQSFAYVAGEYDQPAAFENLAKRLVEIDREHQLGRQSSLLSGDAPGRLPPGD